MSSQTATGACLSVNINAETKRALEELAEREQVTVTEVVRRAISVYKFVEDELADGQQSLQLVDNETKERTTLTLNEGID